MSTTGHPLSCDRVVARPAPAGGSSAHSVGVLAAAILASSLAFIDGSVVNVGLPAIRAGLEADGGGLAWVVNGYLLPLSALLLIGGAAGDAFGRRRLLVRGVVLFALASVACAMAPSLGWLIAGRAAQGVGAALLMPNSLAILGASFAGEARGRAIGVWAGVGAGASAIGPLIGGWLVDSVGWRAIFFINLPLAAAAVALALRYIDDDHGRDPPPLDLMGAVLAAGGLGALTFGLTEASSAQKFTPAALSTLAAGAALLAAFIAVERTRGEAAMMPLTLFASRQFVGLTLVTALLYGALGGLLVVIPYVLIDAQGFSATAAGAALLPLPLIIAAGSSSMGALAGRVGPRLPLTIGPLLVAAGCLLATRMGAAADYWTTTFPALVLVSVGMAASAAPLTVAVLASVDARQTGVASGFNSAVARTGGLAATALASAVLAAHGPALITAFHHAALIGAMAALLGGACAFLLVARAPARRA